MAKKSFEEAGRNFLFDFIKRILPNGHNLIFVVPNMNLVVLLLEQ